MQLSQYNDVRYGIAAGENRSRESSLSNRDSSELRRNTWTICNVHWAWFEDSLLWLLRRPFALSLIIKSVPERFCTVAKERSFTTRPELLRAAQRYAAYRAAGDDAKAGELIDYWNEFCEFYERLLRDYCQQNRLKQKETDELLQRVRINIWRAFSHGFVYGSKPGKFRAWLWTIVGRTAISMRRELNRRRQAERDGNSGALRRHQDEGAKQPSEASQVEEDRLRVHEVLTNMRERGLSDQADILERCYLDGFKPAEIAVEMGKTPDAVRQLLSRARETFRTTARRLFFEDLGPDT